MQNLGERHREGIPKGSIVLRIISLYLTCARDLLSLFTLVRMCLRNLGIVWGNYLIIEVAGIPLHIGEHPEHFGCNMSINIQSIECQA